MCRKQAPWSQKLSLNPNPNRESSLLLPQRLMGFTANEKMYKEV